MLSVIVPIISGAGSFVLAVVLFYIISKVRMSSAMERSKTILSDAEKNAESKKKEILLEAKEKLYQDRQKLEDETRQQQEELKQTEKRIFQREQTLEKRVDGLDKKEQRLEEREHQLKTQEEELTHAWEEEKAQLEKISGLSAQEAKDILFKKMENQTRSEAQLLVQKIEEDARTDAEKKARWIVASSIQRSASTYTAEETISSVSLPSDDIKGRIIGREGRNIRALEQLTGVDLIIDDTPEAVIISGFDPIRREIARICLERLILDGRIHPARIEEVYEQVKTEVDKIMFEAGEKAAIDLGVHGINKKGINAIGRLKYRTSYGQNVLEHSREVAELAGMIAGELGANAMAARRAGLLHDIGKATQTEGEGAHAISGAEMARTFSEDDKIVNAVEAHHGEVQPKYVEAIIVAAADAISASREGARKESLENYLKRLKDLENLAMEFKGIEKCFAIQAGREIRIMVDTQVVDDTKAKTLAREIALKIEKELKYPGQIKITLIRESRFSEYAR